MERDLSVQEKSSLARQQPCHVGLSTDVFAKRCCRSGRHASEADARQRVFNKQRVLDAKHAKQLRGEAKRRREQASSDVRLFQLVETNPRPSMSRVHGQHEQFSHYPNLNFLPAAVTHGPGFFFVRRDPPSRAKCKPYNPS